MVTLALVGAPSRLTYEAFKAAKAAGGALGALFGAAQAAAVSGMIGSTAAALGAGALGFFIGDQILKSLEEPQELPPPGEYYEFNTPGQFAEAQFDTFVDGEQRNFGIWGDIGETPTRGLFNAREGALWSFYFIDKNGTRRNLFTTASSADSAEVRILNFRLKGTNTPVVPTKKLPSYAPNKNNPVKPVPTTVPIPGFPGFPISPRVVPNPGNDEPEEGEERTPGVVVQVPELGMQFRFTPGDVQITNYNAPNKEPFRVPPPIAPPNGKAATPRCCEDDSPEPEPPNFDEIICRLKALQDELLNDGTDRVSGGTPTAQSGFYEDLDGGFYKVQMNLVDKPRNAKVQPSTSPAMDVIFCGWFAWVENGFPGERLPIHFQNQTFLAPSKVTGFMYQYYSAHSGNAQWQRRTKREYVDFCVPADAS